MNNNLELYKVFYSVAKNKSMTKAASELLVSQPAVSKSIQTLENQLGGVLFIRSTKGLSLTEEGKIFYDKVNIALSLIREAESSFGDFKDMKLGEVKIGVSSVLTKILLINTVKKYRNMYPGVNISIVNGLTSDLIYQLNKGKLDFVIYNESDIKEKNVNIKYLTDLKYVFAYNPAEFDVDDNIDVETLITNYPIILQNSNSNTRKFLNAYLKEKDIDIAPKMQVVSQELICDFIKSGAGVGFVLEDLVKKYHNDLKTIEINDSLITKVFIATNKASNPTFAAEKFLNLVCEK